MYDMLCTRPDICYAVGMVSRYQSNLGLKYQTVVKYIFKYLRRTRDYMLTYGGSDLIPIDYTNSDFMSDMDYRKSISEYGFKSLGGAVVSWRSIKQQCIIDSTLQQLPKQLKRQFGLTSFSWSQCNIADPLIIFIYVLMLNLTILRSK